MDGPIPRMGQNRPRDIKHVLTSLPRTLDETYDRILQNIGDTLKREAFVALQWLVFSARPLYLAELAEACVVNPSQGLELAINEEDRLSSTQDLFGILGGLITVSEQDGEFESGRGALRPANEADLAKYEREGADLVKEDWAPSVTVENMRTVKLAHFSVKEYLVSHRIRSGPAKTFAVEEKSAEQSLAYIFLLH
ncbi:hypothetical protein BDD12DRAFT_807524 [Trichophaea hybrida]|nr:hypothetical protein BDD12DRAFT_807524 [Trichophaea hybrida]